MDYRRAQRNLDLINEHADIDDQIQPDLDTIENNEDAEELIGTQVPLLKFSQSSKSSQEGSLKVNSSNFSSPVKMDKLNEQNAADYIKRDNQDISENEEMPSDGKIDKAETEDVNIENDGSIFISTQIQSRLDTFEHDLEAKSKLQHFKYSLEPNLGIESVEKPISKPKRQRSTSSLTQKPSSKKNKVNRSEATKGSQNSDKFYYSRAQNLLKQLSGKHRKVQDIIRVQRETETSLISNANKSKASYSFDVYNAEEWKKISRLLQNIPQSNTQDVREVYTYLYGNDDTEDMWNSSQRPPKELNLQSLGSNLETVGVVKSTQVNAEALKLLSLSQVMDDTSEQEKSLLITQEHIANDDASSNDDSLLMTQERIVTDSKIGEIELLEEKITQEQHITNPTVSTTDRNVMSNQCPSKEKRQTSPKHYTQLESDIMREHAIRRDSVLPQLHHPDKNGLDKDDSMIIDGSPSDNTEISDNDMIIPDSMDDLVIELPVNETIKSQVTFLDNIPLLEPVISRMKSISPKRTAEEDDIIDLTQESFKVVNKLISPVKSDKSTRREVVALSVENVAGSIEVPATRSSTVMVNNKNDSKQILDFTINVKLSSSTCDKIINRQIPFEFTDTSEYIATTSKDDMVIKDSECDEPADIQPLVLEIKSHENHLLENVSTRASSPNKKSSNIIMSQTAQELRQQLKDIGLKPSRIKSQMTESLEAASQILTQDSVSKESKIDIFNHLTRLVKQSPPLLEKIQTMQPILLETFLLELVELDPFVDRIDGSTIQSWADKNGISLKRT